VGPQPDRGRGDGADQPKPERLARAAQTLANRWRNPGVYESGVALFEKYGGERGIEPIPELWDQCLSDIAIAEVLHIPAEHVRDTPEEYQIAAVLKLRADAIVQQEHQKEAEKARRR
jgi:hypothetical protein